MPPVSPVSSQPARPSHRDNAHKRSCSPILHQYYIVGQGRMTLFENMARARTADFRPGDVGDVPKTFGHYIENTGKTDLVVMEVFKADRFEEISLSDWLAHSPPEMVAETLNLDPSVIAQFPKNRPDIMPV